MITTPNDIALRDGIQVIRDVVGGPWLDKCCRRWTLADSRHRLLGSYKYALAALQRFEGGDEYALHNEHVLYMQRLGSDLKAVYPLLNDTAELASRLRQESEFEKCAYELSIAAEYSRRGLAVSYRGKLRGHDLTIVLDAADLKVECKCKDRATEQETKIRRTWKDLCDRTTKEMAHRRINGLVYINTRNQPSRSHVPTLVATMAEVFEAFRTGAIDQDAVRHVRIDNVGYVINFRDLTIGGHMPQVAKGVDLSASQSANDVLSAVTMLQCKLRRGYEFGDLQTAVLPGFDEQPRIAGRRFTSFRGVFTNSDCDPQYSKGLRQTLSLARQQIAQAPAVVCIDIPHHHATSVVDRLESAAVSVESFLRRDTKRINAVLLTCTAPHPNPAEFGRTEKLITVARIIFNASPRVAVSRDVLTRLGPCEKVSIGNEMVDVM